MRPYLALTSLLFGLHLGAAAVAALGLPAPVLGLAAFAVVIALHELYVMARSLRPLVLAGYAGAMATLPGG